MVVTQALNARTPNAPTAGGMAPSAPKGPRLDTTPLVRWLRELTEPNPQVTGRTSRAQGRLEVGPGASDPDTNRGDSGDHTDHDEGRHDGVLNGLQATLVPSDAGQHLPRYGHGVSTPGPRPVTHVHTDPAPRGARSAPAARGAPLRALLA